MATLERVMQMKQQGMTEPQIIGILKQEGVSPKEINDSLTQSNIKSAITPQAAAPATNQAPAGAPIQGAQEMSGGPMEPSIMPQQGNEPAPAEQYPPEQAPEQYPPEQYPPQQYPSEQDYPENYPQYPEYADYQQGYPEYQPQQQMDAEAISDITQQIVEEKNAELKRQIATLINFKEEINSEVERINERLKKVEDSFDDLQMAILGKIGEHGEDIKNIAKEMRATQDSFSKVLNPLTDNIRELQKITGNKKPEDNKEDSEKKEDSKKEEKDSKEEKSSRASRKRSKKSDKEDFENYLR